MLRAAHVGKGLTLFCWLNLCVVLKEEERSAKERVCGVMKKLNSSVQQDSTCSSEAVELIQSLSLVVDTVVLSDNGYQSEYNAFTLPFFRGSWDSSLLEHQTHDGQVASSNPGRSG